MRSRRRCRPPQSVLGAVLVLAGLLWLLAVTGVIQTERIWAYWPAIFGIVGALKLLSRERGQVIAGLCWIAVSLLLLDLKVGLFGYELFKAAPVLLIVAGGILLWRGRRRTLAQEGLPQSGPERGEDLSFVAVFGNAERTVASPRFRSGDVMAIFGGCDLDFQPAQIDGEAELNVFACFGGVTILVPETWTVVSHGVAILGGFAVDTERVTPEEGEPQEISGPRLIIRGTAFLGGVNVTNQDSWWRQKRQHRDALRQRAFERMQRKSQ